MSKIAIGQRTYRAVEPDTKDRGGRGAGPRLTSREFAEARLEMRPPLPFSRPSPFPPLGSR